MRLAVVDHQRLAEPLGEPDVPPEGALLAVGRGEVPVVVEPGLPHRDDARVRGEPLDLGEVGSSVTAAVRVGCSATAATTRSSQVAASTTHRAEARSSATVTARVTPPPPPGPWPRPTAPASWRRTRRGACGRRQWTSATAPAGRGGGFTGGRPQPRAAQARRADRAPDGHQRPAAAAAVRRRRGGRLAAGARHRAIGAHSGPVSPSSGSSLREDRRGPGERAADLDRRGRPPRLLTARSRR